MSHPLFLTLPLGNDETPCSFVSRLAARHGKSARFFCTDVGLQLQKIADGDEASLAELARISGADPATIRRNALVRGAGDYRLRGERLLTSSVERGRSRFCPECIRSDIAEEPALPRTAAVRRRIAWLIEHIHTCVRHEVALIDLPVVEAERYDFAAMMARPSALDAEIAPQAANALEAYLVGRLDGERSPYPWLDALEFGAAAKICEMVGAIAVGGSKVAIDPFGVNEWRTCQSAGFPIVAGGEAGLRRFFNQLQARLSTSRRPAGPNAVLGTFYQWAHYASGDPCFDPLRNIIRTHIAETIPVGPEDDVLGLPIRKRVLHSVQTAAKELKTHPRRLQKILVAKGFMNAKYENEPYGCATFEASALDDLEKTGAIAGMSFSGFSQYIGGSVCIARCLIENEFIVPAFTGSDIGSPSARLSIVASDVDAFVGRLCREAQPISAASATMATIAVAAKRVGCGAATIIRTILAQELRWVGRLESCGYTFPSILVDVEEIDRKFRCGKFEGLTAAEIMKRTGYRRSAVKALIDHRILKGERYPHPINAMPIVSVTTEALAAFQAKYASLSDLARERPMHHTSMKKLLEAQGIQPAFDPKEFHAFFYERRRLQNL